MMSKFATAPLTPEHDGLLAAIASNPDDDTARLVFADWLDEHDRPQDACDQRLAVLMRAIIADKDNDEPRLRYAEVCEQYGRVERGEFIRDQITVFRGPDCGHPKPPYVVRGVQSDCPICVSHNRSLHYLTQQGCPARWLTFCQVSRSAVVRGFAEFCYTTADQWLKYGDVTCANHPLRKVTLTTMPRIEILDSTQAPTSDAWLIGRMQGRSRYHNIPYSVATQNNAEYVLHLLRAEWPSIEFELPHHRQPVAASDNRTY